MWISKKKLEQERIKYKNELLFKSLDAEAESRQWDDIQKLKKDVKKLKKQMRELY